MMKVETRKLLGLEGNKTPKDIEKSINAFIDNVLYPLYVERCESDGNEIENKSEVLSALVIALLNLKAMKQSGASTPYIGITIDGTYSCYAEISSDEKIRCSVLRTDTLKRIGKFKQTPGEGELPDVDNSEMCSQD